MSDLRPLRGFHDIEIAQRLLGHGGERNAFLMHFLAPTRFTTPDEEWVVKESRHTRTPEEEIYFHRKGLVTQKAAEELANRFNAEAEGLGLSGLPKVRFAFTCCSSLCLFLTVLTAPTALTAPSATILAFTPSIHPSTGRVHDLLHH